MPKRRGNGEGMVRRRADGRWEARYTDPRELDPKKRVKSIVSKSQKTVIDLLKTAQAEITSGKTLLIDENPTLSEWLDTWMKEYKLYELRDSTFDAYCQQIERYINPHLGSIKVKQLSGQQIQSLYGIMQKPKRHGGLELSSATVIKVRNILSGALQQALANNLIAINPLSSAKPPKLETADIRIMTKKEQQAFLSVLSAFNTGNMFAFALMTGVRLGELCALEFSDINRVDKYISITKAVSRKVDKHTGEASMSVGAPKTTHSVRKIPLLPSAEVILDRQANTVEKLKSVAGEMWSENNLVFPTDTGKHHDASGMRSSLGRILKRAGLPHMTIHALRHTYATNALNSGVAAQNVARLLGHKDGATTLKFYAHYISSEAVKQLEGLESRNINNLGLSLDEVSLIGRDEMRANSVAKRISDAIAKTKHMEKTKGADMVLAVCENALCESYDTLTPDEKDKLLQTMAQFLSLKNQLGQSRAEQIEGACISDLEIV